ncbi:uncharacterized protein JN550_013630 [Neoarthrinium moseri]|uniref:uncharacterized protein n=1 Tax=Neoarthrinium moseri TaxID=1658444 RepID=UPI001FDD977B|nr:uncharacterized protein JN550_013630 [Neoarthrinium moseri]KAI1856885.1 hypothetical protein JN550_013630 [Neoarthrinium moseri]
MFVISMSLLRSLTWAVVGSIIIYCAYRVIYNAWIHPLSKFPGPILCKVTNVPYAAWFLGGRQPYKMTELHAQYGPIVRVSPDELSFNSAQSWQDIYGHRADRKILVKGRFYDGGSYAGIGTKSIVSERDPSIHRQMRSYLAGAFSDRSFKEQQGLISMNVDRFIELAGLKSELPAGFDVVALLEMLTFDITGDLAFGQSFNCLRDDQYHPWISISLGALAQGALVEVFNRFPTIAKLCKVVLRHKIEMMTADTRKNEYLALDIIKRRILADGTRSDFLTRILDERDKSAISDRQIAAHASDLVVAGSDTSATALATCLHYLLRDDAVMAKLTTEVRQSFAQYDEISNTATVPLKYLGAVIEEALRIYPPLPLGLPRIVPEGGAIIDGCFIPQGARIYRQLVP